MIEFYTSPFRVRYVETDQMGFVHHSNYFRYFEMARIEWLNSIGLSYKKLEETGIFMPVVQADVKFKIPALFDDILVVVLKIDQLPASKLVFNYSLINQFQKEIAIGSSSLAFLDKKKKKPVKCPLPIVNFIQSKL